MSAQSIQIGLSYTLDTWQLIVQNIKFPSADPGSHFCKHLTYASKVQELSIVYLRFCFWLLGLNDKILVCCCCNCHFSVAEGPHSETHFLLLFSWFSQIKESFAGSSSFLALCIVKSHLPKDFLVYVFERKMSKWHLAMREPATQTGNYRQAGIFFLLFL